MFPRISASQTNWGPFTCPTATGAGTVCESGSPPRLPAQRASEAHSIPALPHSSAAPRRWGLSPWDPEGHQHVSVQSRGYSMVPPQIWAPLLSLTITCSESLGNWFCCYIAVSQIPVTAKIALCHPQTGELAINVYKEL